MGWGMTQVVAVFLARDEWVVVGLDLGLIKWGLLGCGGIGWLKDGIGRAASDSKNVWRNFKRTFTHHDVSFDLCWSSLDSASAPGKPACSSHCTNDTRDRKSALHLSVSLLFQIRDYHSATTMRKYRLLLFMVQDSDQTLPYSIVCSTRLCSRAHWFD